MHFEWSTAIIQVITIVFLLLVGYLIYRFGKKPSKKKVS